MATAKAAAEEQERRLAALAEEPVAVLALSFLLWFEERCHPAEQLLPLVVAGAALCFLRYLLVPPLLSSRGRI